MTLKLVGDSMSNKVALVWFSVGGCQLASRPASMIESAKIETELEDEGAYLKIQHKDGTTDKIEVLDCGWILANGEEVAVERDDD